MRQTILVADLGYGDAGKGSIVDYLTRKYNAHCVVRYNGGAQAAHNVVTPDGRHHTFAQFGSGTFIPGTSTHLSRFMLVNPISLLAEAEHLEENGIANPCARVSIDRGALIITPFQQAANRLKEIARSAERHGSCGMGIGETMSDYLAYGGQMLTAGDLLDRTTLTKKLQFIQELKRSQLADLIPTLPDTEAARRERCVLEDTRLIEDCADVYQFFADSVVIVDENYLQHVLNAPGTVIFEGAQGVLLDEWYGFHPYTTWSTTSFENAQTLLDESGYTGKVLRLGLLRAYATRHGPGPFVTEETSLTAALPELHNTTNDWQRAFRVGHLDLVAARYALEVVGKVDGLAITALDRLATIPEWKVCDRYQYTGTSADLSSYFGLDGATINAIKMQRPPDLAHQEQLTRFLRECAPMYQQIYPTHANALVEHDIAAYLSLLEQMLRLPVMITSAGPTAADKRAYYQDSPALHA